MRRALRAVQAQDCAPGLLTHLVFIDGPRPGVDAASLRALSTRHPVHVVQLPYAVGTNGWLGVCGTLAPRTGAVTRMQRMTCTSRRSTACTAQRAS